MPCCGIGGYVGLTVSVGFLTRLGGLDIGDLDTELTALILSRFFTACFREFLKENLQPDI